jgi:hypothetical protein
MLKYKGAYWFTRNEYNQEKDEAGDQKDKFK